MFMYPWWLSKHVFIGLLWFGERPLLYLLVVVGVLPTPPVKLNLSSVFQSYSSKCFWAIVISSSTCLPWIQGESLIQKPSSPAAHSKQFHTSTAHRFSSTNQVCHIVLTLVAPSCLPPHIHLVAKFWSLLCPLDDLPMYLATPQTRSLLPLAQTLQPLIWFS